MWIDGHSCLWRAASPELSLSAALEDGFLEARTTGNVRAEAAARAATTTLPDGAAVRSLRDLLKG
jgi:hypothetical protein